MTADDDLWRQLEVLTERVQRLEQLLQAQALPAVAPEPRKAAPVPWTPQRSPANPLTPPAKGAPPPSQHDRQTLEARLGSQIFNRIGIFALLVGMAWFLKFAIDNQWVGPLGRVVIGMIAGAAIILWSERFRRRGYPLFSYSLKAVGSGTLYLSLWAAYGLYHLLPSGVAFGLMVLVTLWNGFMAWAQDAELLALYAIIGGFSTPVLVSTGENHELILFSYLLVLDVAVIALIMRRPWVRLIVSAFAGTLLLASGWAMRFYADSAFWLTACFVALFFVVFAMAPRLARLNLDDAARPSRVGWEHLAFIVMPLANAALSFYAFYNMLEPSGRQWARPWVAVAFAAFYLLILQRPPRRHDGESLSYVAAFELATAVVFLTLAIPLAAHGHWLVIGWLVEGAALMWLARRSSLALLRTLAIGALLLGVIALLELDPDAAGMIVFNPRFAAYLVGIVVFAGVAWLATKSAPEERGSEGAMEFTLLTPEMTVPWRTVAACSVILTNFLILFAVRLEIHNYWYTELQRQLEAHTFVPYPAPRPVMYEEFSQSVWAMLFGALLLAAGFWKRSAFLRWQALCLLALSIAKVFIVDVSALSQGYRVISFLGLGVLLLAISFVYQRDWLGLRAVHAESNTPADSGGV